MSNEYKKYKEKLDRLDTTTDNLRGKVNKFREECAPIIAQLKSEGRVLGLVSTMSQEETNTCWEEEKRIYFKLDNIASELYEFVNLIY